MTWDEIYTRVAQTADKVAVKIHQTTDRAALEIKRTAQEKRLSDAYESLGKLFYQSLSDEEKKHDAEIADAVEQIAHAEAELEAIRIEIQKSKESASPSA